MFYRATLAELLDAVNALRAYDEGIADMFSWGVREVSYWSAAPMSKNLKRTDIYDHKFDKEAKKRRFKNTKPMKVTIDGKEQ